MQQQTANRWHSHKIGTYFIFISILYVFLKPGLAWPGPFSRHPSLGGDGNSVPEMQRHNNLKFKIENSPSAKRETLAAFDALFHEFILMNRVRQFEIILCSRFDSVVNGAAESMRRCVSNWKIFYYCIHFHVPCGHRRSIDLSEAVAIRHSPFASPHPKELKKLFANG